MSIYPEANVSVPNLGDVRAAITSGKTVHLSTASDQPHLVYRGREFYVSVHLELVNGTWQIPEPEATYRRVLDSESSKTAPATFLVAILDAIKKGWLKYLEQNPTILLVAQRNAVNMQVESIGSDIKKKQQELLALEKQYRLLKDRRDVLDKDIGLVASSSEEEVIS